SAMRIQYFHGSSPNAPVPAWDSPSKNSKNRAPGLSPTRGALRGAPESRVQLANGLKRTKEKSTSVPARRRTTLTRRAGRFHALRVGNVGGELARNKTVRDGVQYCTLPRRKPGRLSPGQRYSSVSSRGVGHSAGGKLAMTVSYAVIASGSEAISIRCSPGPSV